MGFAETNTIRVYSDLPFEGVQDKQKFKPEDLDDLAEKRFIEGEYGVRLVLTHPNDDSDTRSVHTCQQMRHLRGRDWYARTTLAMGAWTGMKEGCQIADHLSRADTFSVNHIPGDREWWTNVSADVIHKPHRLKIIRGLRQEKQGYVNKVTEADTLGEFGKIRRSDTHSVSIEINRFHDNLVEDTFTIIDHYDLRRVALADFDGDAVSELLVSASRVPDAKPVGRGYFGTIHGIGSGRVLVLDRDSPSVPLTLSRISEQSMDSDDG